MITTILILALAPVSQVMPDLDRQTTVLEVTPMALDRAVDPYEYVVGPGDVLGVVVEGGCTPAMLSAGLAPQGRYPVSSDGAFAVSGIGQVDAESLTIAGLQERLESMARMTYPRISIGLSLVQSRQVRVRISGSVFTPGEYVLTAVHRVSDLVASAGGLTSYSSRLGVMLPGGGDLELELNLLLDPATGRPFSDPYLMNGAVVRFEPCLEPVYVEIGRNLTVWDLMDPRDLGSFLQRMGGAPGDIDLAVSMHRRNGVETAVWSPDSGYAAIELEPGDTLLLAEVPRSVTVSGAVAVPGPQPFHPSMTVQDYIAAAGGVVSTGRLGGTELRREGEPVETGGDALGSCARRGDVIEVPYSWVARNGPWISLLASLVSIVVVLDSALSN